MEAQDQTRIESRIAELKYKMWDKLPPTYLPFGELIINTSIESSPTITFTIPARSTDVEDENGEFGIRKNDTNVATTWQIYSVSNGEVIKQSTSYSKFFDGSDWDPGTSELGGNIFTASKQIPVTIHEKIDGTVRSAKDINYKYPQIFNVEWSNRIVGDPKGGRTYLQVNLSFVIRSDVNLLQSSYSINRSVSNLVEPRMIEEDRNGIIYNWSSTPLDSVQIGSSVKFSIITTRDINGSLGSSGIGGTNNLVTFLDYIVQ